VFCFASYRDPHIKTTLEVFDKAAVFIKSGKYYNEDIKEAILQVCAEIDKPDTPAYAAKRAFYRKILSLSDEQRLQFKERLLAVTRESVIETAEKYFVENNQKQSVAVVSSEEKLKETNKKMKNNPLKLYKI